MRAELDKICDHCRLNRAQAANILGVSVRTIVAWQSGYRQIPGHMANKLASVARLVERGYCSWVVMEMLSQAPDLPDIVAHLGACRDCRRAA